MQLKSREFGEAREVGFFEAKGVARGRRRAHLLRCGTWGASPLCARKAEVGGAVAQGRSCRGAALACARLACAKDLGQRMAMEAVLKRVGGSACGGEVGVRVALCHCRVRRIRVPYFSSNCDLSSVLRE